MFASLSLPPLLQRHRRRLSFESFRTMARSSQPGSGSAFRAWRHLVPLVLPPSVGSVHRGSTLYPTGPRPLGPECPSPGTVVQTPTPGSRPSGRAFIDPPRHTWVFFFLRHCGCLFTVILSLARSYVLKALNKYRN